MLALWLDAKPPPLVSHELGQLLASNLFELDGGVGLPHGEATVATWAEQVGGIERDGGIGEGGEDVGHEDRVVVH